MNPKTITSEVEEVEQLDNMNLLYDIRKIKCELIFYNKEKNPFFFDEVKNILTEEVNTINSFNYKDDRKSFYLKYIEHDSNDFDSQKDFILNTNTCIYIFLTIVSPSLRQEQISNFEAQIEEINTQSNTNMSSNSALIFFYQNEEELKKSEKLNVKYPNNIFYVKTNLKELELKKKETKTQLTNIMKQIVLNGFMTCIQQKEKINDKIKYNTSNLDMIKTRVGEYLQICDAGNAIPIIDKCIIEYYYEERGRWEEIRALIIYYSDAKKAEIEGKKIEYNQSIIDLMELARKRYEKEKKYENAMYNLYRQSNYYMKFIPEKINIFDECLVKACKMLIELKPTDIEYKFVQYLRLSELYKRVNIMKKSNMYFLLSSMICIESNELKLMLPYMIKKLKNMYDIYDVSTNIIENVEQFKDIHKWLVLNKRKPISFFVKAKNETDNEKYEMTFKKKIEPKKKLSVRRNLENISMYIFKLFWKEIQYYINMKIMAFYNEKKDFENNLIYSLGYLQSMTSMITPEKQKSIMIFNIRNSLSTQKKVFLNISKLPLLMRIIPVISNIGFEVSTNTSKKKNNDIFLYNPWEQNKLINNNYYWTTNSYHQIKIQFYNPLDIELEINKIHIIFEGAQPTVYPSSVIIPPKTSLFITTKIHPNKEGITTIIGVKYEMINTVGIQYVDDNGNGLFYNYENKYIDPSKAYMNLINENKPQLISLSDIKIYPEIPKLNYKILGDELIHGKISLFDNQLYTFKFQLKNIGIYDVDQLICYIYVYKTNNYKVTLEEINQNVCIKKNGGEYIFNYNYWHKSAYQKIELKIYYNSKEKTEKSLKEDDIILKPYLYFSSSIETFPTFSFSSISIKPMIMSTDINELALIDKKITYNYTSNFCSNKNYIGFLVENIHESQLEIVVYDELHKEDVQKEVIDGQKAKELSTLIRTDSSLKDICLKWKLTDLYNCEGKIILNDLIPYYNIIMWKKFSFYLRKIQREKSGIKYFKCFFSIRNNQKVAHEGLKFQIYIYQSLSGDEENNFIYNKLLEDKLFVDGCLSLNINKMEPKEEFKYEISLFPLKKEDFYVTCLLLDKDKKEVYFCPSVIDLKM